MMGAGPRGSAAHFPEKIKTSSGPLNLPVKDAQREKKWLQRAEANGFFSSKNMPFGMTFVVTSKLNLFLLTEGWKLSTEERKSGSD